MHRTKAILRQHWVVCVFALFIAVFMAGPELFMQASLGNAFKGVYTHGSDAELMYLARMQQTYNGTSAWDNPFLSEYQGKFPLTYALFSEPVLAYPGKWLGIPVPELNIIYKFIFSAVIFILMYSFAFRLMGDTYWSIATAVFIMASYRLVTLPGITAFLNWKMVYNQFSTYSRPVTSQVSWMAFWGFLHLLLSALRSRKLRYFLGCGIIFGLAFYIYPYNWTFLAVICGIIAVGAFFFRQKKLTGRIAVILGIGAVIGTPAILNALAVVRNEYFQAFSVIAHLGASRVPNVSKLGVIILVLFLWRFKKNYRQHDSALLLILLITTFVVTNQQVFTNHILEVGHYYWFFNAPIYILTGFYMAWQAFVATNPKRVRPILSLVVILSFLNLYLMQSSSYKANIPKAEQNQKYAAVFQWLNDNTQPGSVVLASDGLSFLVSAYTHNHLYWVSAAQFYLMPPERFEAALFMFMKLSNLKPSALGGESFFHSNPSADQLQLALADPESGITLTEPLRETYRDGMLKRYTEFYQKNWDDNLRQFRLDYIIRDPGVNSAWDLRGIKSLKLVQVFGDVTIYKNYHE